MTNHQEEHPTLTTNPHPSPSILAARTAMSEEGRSQYMAWFSMNLRYLHRVSRLGLELVLVLGSDVRSASYQPTLQCHMNRFNSVLAQGPVANRSLLVIRN